MKVSFDFDKCLQRQRVQDIANKHISDMDEVWIITRRFENENAEVIEIANKLGIDSEHIIFTNGEWKWNTLKDMNIDIHYDDKLIEILLIERYTNTKGILI